MPVTTKETKQKENTAAQHNKVDDDPKLKMKDDF